ncbi:MAG: malectin domain-containing carbohydrate-binding protein [Candidatus Acidiferrales bacterium]
MKKHGIAVYALGVALFLVLLTFFATAKPTAAQTQIIAINSGGPTVSPFVADEDFTGGGTIDHANTIDTSHVTNPAPAAVYQTARDDNFSYTIGGFTAGTNYLVRLHFAETYFAAAGSRTFNVSINGTQVLTDFDIFATAGGKNIANIQQFTEPANSSGQFVIVFTSVVNNALVSGIEIDSTSSSCAAAPTAPSGLTATAVSSSQINLSWTASTAGSGCTITYNVYRSTTSGFTPGSGNQITSGLTTTSYSNTGLTAATTYYYLVEGVDSVGSSAASNQASATTQSSGGGTQLIAIDSGSTTAVSPFVADEDFTGGATLNHANTIDTSKVTNPAPAAVYQTGRDGNFSYTIGGFTAGTSYLVRLHFCETYFTSAGKRTFNVSINGTQVLSAFDIFAAAGGQNIANIQQFTEPANSSGQFVIVFTSVVNNSLVSGIEVDSTSSSCAAAPTAPSGLSATATSSSQINLSWTASTAGSGCTISYNVYRSTTSGFTPSSSNQIATGLTTTSYSNTGLAASTTYYYLVEGVDSAGSSAASNQASATTQASTCSAAPTAPSGLTATDASSSQINLSWGASTAGSGCTITYNVYRSTTSGFTPSSSNEVANGGAATSYSDTGLTASTTYYYLVEGVDSVGSSPASNQASATTAGTGSVAPPTSLTAVGSSYQQIDLRWVASTTPEPNTTPVNYEIYRSTTTPFTPSSSNQIGTTIGITNFVDSNYAGTTSPPTSSGIAPSTTYYYQVIASTSSGTSSAASASATSLPATPSSAAPAALTGLTAMAQNANEIDLIWNSTNSGVGTVVTTYTIYRSTTTPFTPGTSNKIGTTKSNWFQDVLGTASTQYYYQVLASNSIGTSPSSSTVTATTPALNPNLWGGAPYWDASGLPTKQNVVMLKFLNRTNGQYTDSQIIWTASINGVASQFTIAQQPYYDMPANSSGRMYFYLNDPTLAQNDTNYWDFIEFTVGPTSINFDTTRVDAFGVKIGAYLSCADGTNVAVGENQQTFQEDRSVTFQRYANGVPSTAGGNFQEDLKYQPYRIVEPGGAGFGSGGDNQNYYQTYISNIWSYNGITGVAQAGPNGSGLGCCPSLSAAIYRHTAPISAATSPTGAPEFNSAGSLTNNGMWGNPATFYQLDPYDHYAQWIEAQAINDQQYAFPYNDAGGYSSDVSCSNPNTLLITIGW